MRIFIFLLIMTFFFQVSKVKIQPEDIFLKIIEGSIEEIQDDSKEKIIDMEVLLLDIQDELETSPNNYELLKDQVFINKSIQIEEFKLEKLAELKNKESISVMADEIKIKMENAGADKPKIYWKNGRGEELKEIIKSHVIEKFHDDLQAYILELESTED